jgi:hypothetical protein
VGECLPNWFGKIVGPKCDSCGVNRMTTPSRSAYDSSFCLHPLIRSSELDGNRDRSLIGNTDEYEQETYSVLVVGPQLFAMFFLEGCLVPAVTKDDHNLSRSS